MFLNNGTAAMLVYRTNRKTLDSNDQNQVADQRFSLKRWFAGDAQSRGLRKPGCDHCYLRLFQLILQELSSIVMQTFSFVSVEKQGY